MTLSKKENKILIIGADSLIGKALSEKLRSSEKDVLETSRRKEGLSETRIFLDLEHDVSSWDIPENVTTAFFCAAFNSLEYCYREPERTSRVNVDHTVKLTKKLVEKGIFVAFFSTNLVYDGSVPFVKADDPVCPRTEHGKQKAEAEKQLLPMGNLVSTIRFSKIFWPQMPLLQGWLSSLKKKEAIRPFKDKVISPLSLSFAIEVFCRVAEKRISGLLQFSGNGDVTYENIAYQATKRLGVSANLVQPVLALESGVFLEHLPQNTTLDATRLVQELGISMPDIRSTLNVVIDQNIRTFKRKHG